MNYRMHEPLSFFKKQRGVVAFLMVFIVALGAAAYLVKTINAFNLYDNQEKKTYQSLAKAKSALIAWSVSHKYTPGQMPWPDRNGDGNYDGSSDCVATTFQYSYLLGQLPTMPATSPCLDPNTGSVSYTGLSTYPGLGEDLRDAQGNKLWYAVSRNLVRDYVTATNPVINSGISNSPTYPWLQVLDRNGNLVSDRVAVVIIAPGDPIGGQDRSGIANASEYLDSFQIGAATFNNRSYATADEDFIMGEDSRNVSANDTSLNKPYYFNDKLVYITIDELMTALEKRVGEEARADLKKYRDDNGYYPYAAQLGTTTNFACELTSVAMTNGLMTGFLPANNQSCAYTRVGTTANLACEESIFDSTLSGVTQIRFDRTSGGTIANVSTGACTRNNANRCTCTGAGSCGNVATRISCTSSGCTTTNLVGSYRIANGKFRFRSGGCTQTTFPTKTVAGCSNSNSVITCNISNGSFSSCGDPSFKAYLPTWFINNQWQGYLYYQMTRPASASINVGSKTADAMLATTGAPIIFAPFAAKGSAQVTPSCNAINNYMDSTENTNGDVNFDPTSKLKAANYNDQTFVVTP